LEEAGEQRFPKAPTPEQRNSDLDDLISKAAILLRLNQKEITGGSRRKEVVLGRYLVGYVAVRQQGHPVVDVARKLKVSSQSVLRAIEKGPALIDELGWNDEKD
jgi:hypothetical protein